MKLRTLFLLAMALGLAVFFLSPAQAQQHRATRLGAPATRFAPYVMTPEDLRGRFRDESLRADIGSILHQAGWNGNQEDLHQAAVTAPISEISIPVGTRMPWMSSRENGKPIVLFDVLWAGKYPISAYAFTFTSNGRLYRCVTPRPCTNLFLEDLGAETLPALALECRAPAEIPVGENVEVCLTLRNTGDGPESKTTLGLPVPEGAVLTAATEGGIESDQLVVWTILDLAPNASREVCATFTTDRLGPLPFNPTARGARSQPVESTCSTSLVGIPAILLEVIDVDDPIEVGSEETYVITVTNQGTAPVTNLRLVCTLSLSQEYASSSGPTPASSLNGTVTMGLLQTLAPKAEAVWRVTVKALLAGDVRFKVEIHGDEFERSVWEDEATRQY